MKNYDIKLIALDIDGTILGKTLTLSENLKSTIKQTIQKGIKVVISTGRMFSAAYPILQELGLNTPIIAYQGSMIKDINKVYLHHCLKNSVAFEVINDLRNYDVQINVYNNDELFVEEERPCLAKYVTDRKISYNRIESFNSLIGKEITKLVIINNDKDKMSEIRDIFKAKYGDELLIAKSTPIYCEFVDIKSSKGSGVVFLAKMWGIDPSQIMAIGDQDNDREMLEVAELGVAMGNGSDELKKIADYVTDTAENDGVHKAIQKFVFKNDAI